MKNIKDMSENIEMKTLLQRFCDERIETVLQACVKNNKEYIDTLNDSNRTYKTFQQSGLSAEQLLVFDEAIAIANARGGIYGKEAYCQGFKDGIRLMKEIEGIH